MLAGVAKLLRNVTSQKSAGTGDEMEFGQLVGFRIADCGFRIADYGLQCTGFSARGSSHIPQSAIQLNDIVDAAHNNAIAAHLDHFDPPAVLDKCPFADDVVKVITKASHAGRPERRSGEAHVPHA